MGLRSSASPQLSPAPPPRPRGGCSSAGSSREGGGRELAAALGWQERPGAQRAPNGKHGGKAAAEPPPDWRRAPAGNPRRSDRDRDRGRGRGSPRGRRRAGPGPRRPAGGSSAAPGRGQPGWAGGRPGLGGRGGGAPGQEAPCAPLRPAALLGRCRFQGKGSRASPRAAPRLLSSFPRFPAPPPRSSRGSVAARGERQRPGAAPRCCKRRACGCQPKLCPSHGGFSTAPCASSPLSAARFTHLKSQRQHQPRVSHDPLPAAPSLCCSAQA